MLLKMMSIFLLCFLLTSCSNQNPSNHTKQDEPPTPSQANTIVTPLLLSSYTTEIKTTDPDRYHNITLVRDRLNGYILRNGEEFSYNNVCGPYGPDDGFEEATILLSNGEHDEGYGGGVCQLSSTLYNAIKDLNIKITERHHHSAPVGYVPENQDATISLSSGLDFKFINQTGHDLQFQSTSTEDEITVEVYQI